CPPTRRSSRLRPPCAPRPSRYGRAAPRQPPSFPTRRSSDLHRLEHLGRDDGDLSRRVRPLARISPPRHLPHAGRRSGGQLAVGRSEEHTSELQSRENLVCRLLLDKKESRSLAAQLLPRDVAA